MRKIIIFIFAITNLTCNQAQDKIIYNMTDPGSGLTFREVTMYNDGSLMNDSKVDNVIFIKENGKYYKSLK